MLAPAAREFVLLRITRMRGVDLDLFDFDYDLTWMGFFISADDHVYGRYGGRDAESPHSRVSLPGLRFAMDAALRSHRNNNVRRETPRQPGRRAEQLLAAQSLRPQACIHCHQVYDFRRQELQASGKWRREDLWVYPLPETLGFTLDIDRGDRVAHVKPNSAADQLGLQAGDRLERVNGSAIASFADVQYALHRIAPTGRLSLSWSRAGQRQQALLELPLGWRETDISWRWSLRGVDPAPGVYGEDLTAAEKQSLGLKPERLAFRQGPFVSPSVQRFGIRPNDVVIGIDGKELTMTARQFGAYVRLNHKVGDRIVYNVIRGRDRLNVEFVLASRER